MQYIINTEGKVVFSCSKAGCFSNGQGLCPVQVNGKWGYIDTTGNLVIPCIYEDSWHFENKTAIVKYNGKYGLINKSGKTIVPFQYNNYDLVPVPHDGIICIEVQETADETRIYKCIDTNADQLLTKEALVPIEFSEGLASVWVSHEKGYGVIDINGSFLIPPGDYDFISDFHFGVSRVQKNGKYGYINKTGKIVVDIKYDLINDSDWNPIACVFMGKKFGYMDKRNGNEIISVSLEGDYREIGVYYSDKMSIIHSNSFIYVYNTEECKTYKLTQFNNINRYCNGFCAVEQSGKIGFIDKHCQLVIPCVFESTRSCYSCYFIGESCALEHCIIDRQGKVIRSFPNNWVSKTIPPGHEEKKYLYHIYQSPSEETLFNLKGESICTGRDFYTTLPQCFPVAVQSKTDGKWGFVDQNGKMVVPCQFEDSYSFEDGFATIDEPIRSSVSRVSSNTHVSSGSRSNSSGGCYVATAVYGSYDCPEVWTLRRYRDNVLDHTWYGRLFIRSYYAISPILVKWFGKKKWFKKLLINPLNRRVKELNKRGFEDIPYEDKY